MAIWIAVALGGVMIGLAGLFEVFLRYGRGEVRGRYFGAAIAGSLSLWSYAAVSAIRPDLALGPLTILMLLPAFVAIVLLVREQTRATDQNR